MTTAYPPRETSELVSIYDSVTRALAMGHAGVAANRMWAAHRDAVRAELSRRGFQVNADDAHEQALTDPDYSQREANWDVALGGLAGSALRDMLRHATSLRDKPPASWTKNQSGANYVWIERLTRLLNRRIAAHV